MSNHRERRSDVLVRSELGDDQVYLTTDLPSVEYLTGFTGSNATLAIGPEWALLITDGRYRDQAAAQCPDIEVIIDRNVSAALSLTLPQPKVAIDDRASSAFISKLQEVGVFVTPAPDPVAALRMCKDTLEIENLTRACDITARALADTAAEIKIGQREVEVARRLELRFAELGADDRAFPSIVASGPHSAIPHHQPGNRRLAVGDLLVMDCGAKVNGYHADMTRTFVVGAEPQPWQREIYACVERAQQAGIDALSPGVAASAIDVAVRSVIDDAGFGEAFIHGTGHGVGLQIHEAPMLSRASTAELPENAVITVEPGIYLAGRGGVRIEDSIVVAHPVQVLTDLERSLTRVG